MKKYNDTYTWLWHIKGDDKYICERILLSKGGISLIYKNCKNNKRIKLNKLDSITHENIMYYRQRIGEIVSS